MKNDTLLGKMVVDQGLCTREELDECLSLQQQKEKENNAKSLADILVSSGYVTRSQLERIRPQVEDAQNITQQIPGYVLLSKLGAGAMAVVYKARQISLDRIVAIKILPKRMSSNKEFVERFYKEGKAAAKLNHPNIVGAFDVAEANGYHYFVMEYVEGETVYDRLDRGERYDEKEAINLILQVAKALAHAHAAGLIHRDVKPKNIMITKNGTAKLADMGLAREASDQQAAIAEAGKAYGTPYYISPEQIRGELDIDVRADIYSLGATFYHMVTGRVPFDAPSPSAVMHKHLKEELIPPDHIVPTLSTGVGEVIEVAMAKKRKNRYANIEDMITDLERLAHGEPPLVARAAYDMESLAGLEKSGIVMSPGERQNSIDRAERMQSQDTVDLAPATMKDRMADPLILGLFGSLGVAVVVILLLVLFK